MTDLATRARALRADGHTYAQIGKELGVSRQRAQQLCAGDGSAEVRLVLPPDVVAKIDQWHATAKDRAGKIGEILRTVFHVDIRS